MSAVLTAATALDSAIATFNTAVAGYVGACASVNSAYRASNPFGERPNLAAPAQHIIGILSQTGLTASVLGIVPGAGNLTLAAIHALD